MTTITNNTAIAEIAKDLEALVSEDSQSVPEQLGGDPKFSCPVHHTTLGKDFVSFGLYFPQSVERVSDATGEAFINAYNDLNKDYQLSLSSTSMGKGLIYKGLPSHPHLLYVLTVRIAAN